MPIRSLTYFESDSEPRERRPLRVGEAQELPFQTTEGGDLRLTRYRVERKDPLSWCTGWAISAQVFSKRKQGGGIRPDWKNYPDRIGAFEAQMVCAVTAGSTYTFGDVVIGIDPGGAGDIDCLEIDPYDRDRPKATAGIRIKGDIYRHRCPICSDKKSSSFDCTPKSRHEENTPCEKIQTGCVFLWRLVYWGQLIHKQ